MAWYNKNADILVDEHPSGMGDVTQKWSDEHYPGWLKVSDTFEPFKLNEYKQSAKDTVNIKRNSLEQSTLTYNGHILQVDQLSVQRLTIAASTAQMAIFAKTDFSAGWTCADNTTVQFTAKDFISILEALTAQANKLHIRGREFKDAIDAADTKDEIDAILINVESWSLKEVT